MTMPFTSMHNMLGRAWLRILIAFCVLLLLHLPFSLLRIHSNLDSQQTSGIQLPTVVSLPSVSKPNLSKFEKELYIWTDIADPRRMLYPDLEDGFSCFGNPAFLCPVPVLPVWSLEPCFWPRKEYPESSLAVASKSLAELIHEQWNRDTRVFLLSHEKVLLPAGVFWRISGSPNLLHGIQMPADFSRLAENPDEVKKVTGLTMLEVSSPAFLSYPRVIVRKSCGNFQFDQLAMRAVKEHTYRRLQQIEAASLQKEGQYWLLEVDWRLPKFGELP